MTDKPIADPTARAGVLSFWRLLSDDHQATFDAATLFDGRTLSSLRKMTVDAGFPSYPAPIKDAERRAIASRYAGAEPSPDDPKDLEASLAFTLHALSRAEYQMDELIANDADAGRVWNNGVVQGQIAMWWRWRSEGHDKRAASRENSDAPLARRTSTANAERARERLVRQRRARQIAQQSSKTRGDLIELVHKRLVKEGIEVTKRSVRRYLRK